MDTLNLFLPLNKVDVAKRLVYGTLAAEVADHSGEIMDYETAKPAFKAWSDEIAKNTEGKSLGNVRAMHKSVAAGKLVDIQFDDVAKTITGCAFISDDQEWRKCEDGTYTGFSLGGRYAKRWACPANATLKRYTPAVAEVSIVDMPCIPVATFDVIKADGTHELRKFKAVAEAEGDIEQVWLSKRDGKTFGKKADAQAHNRDLAVTTAIDVTSAAMDALKKAQDAMTSKEPEMEIQHGEPEKAETNVIPVVAPSPLPVIEQSPDEKFRAYADAAKKMMLSKKLCDLPMLVDIIYNLQWLQSNLEWDNLYAADAATTLPANCQAILGDLCTLLKAMVDAATADITEDAAKSISFEQAETLRKFTGNADLLPTVTAPAAAAPAEDLEKARTEHAAELQKRDDALAAGTAREEALIKREEQLTKTVTDLTAGLDDLTKRLDKVERLPAPAKGVLNTTVVHKGHEGAAPEAEKPSGEALALSVSHLSPVEARAALEKAKAQPSK